MTVAASSIWLMPSARTHDERALKKQPYRVAAQRRPIRSWVCREERVLVEWGRSKQTFPSLQIDAVGIKLHFRRGISPGNIAGEYRREVQPGLQGGACPC